MGNNLPDLKGGFIVKNKQYFYGGLKV